MDTLNVFASGREGLDYAPLLSNTARQHDSIVKTLYILVRLLTQPLANGSLHEFVIAYAVACQRTCAYYGALDKIVHRIHGRRGCLILTFLPFLALSVSWIQVIEADFATQTPRDAVARGMILRRLPTPFCNCRREDVTSVAEATRSFRISSIVLQVSKT